MDKGNENWGKINICTYVLCIKRMVISYHIEKDKFLHLKIKIFLLCNTIHLSVGPCICLFSCVIIQNMSNMLTLGQIKLYMGHGACEQESEEKKYSNFDS